jgi:hypothetical protein
MHATGTTMRRMLLAACLSGVALLGVGALNWHAVGLKMATAEAMHWDCPA